MAAGRNRVHPSVLAGFGSASEAYERARPSYPPDAVAWLVERLGIREGSTVVDLAAGTGKLTRLLTSTGARVVAVEPVAEMRVLIESEAVEGYAESMPFPDGFADAVTVAQAFHWFPTRDALVEIARVLHPGGRLGLIWNRRDGEHPVQQAFTAAVEPLRHDEATYKNDAWREPFADQTLFGALTEAEFAWERRLDADALAELASSISFVAAAAPTEREQVLERVRAIAPDGEVSFPYVTRVYVADRA
jgi:ubiquinone/menaquinone biosynthesis C-methylase UbiE